VVEWNPFSFIGKFQLNGSDNYLNNPQLRDIDKEEEEDDEEFGRMLSLESLPHLHRGGWKRGSLKCALINGWD